MIKHFLVALYFIVPVFATAQNSIKQNYYIDTLNNCLSLPFDNCWKIIDNSEINPKEHRICTWTIPSITLICKSREAVKLCTDGQVISIINVEGYFGVIVKYGEYYFSYSSLSEVNVKKGDIVYENQKLGSPGESDTEDNAFEIDIMIMKETKYVKPASWFNLKSGNKEIL